MANIRFLPSPRMWIAGIITALAAIWLTQNVAFFGNLVRRRNA